MPSHLHINNARKIYAAYFRRWLYLLFLGMWRREVAYTVEQRNYIKIAALRLPLNDSDGEPKTTRIFYEGET